MEQDAQLAAARRKEQMPVVQVVAVQRHWRQPCQGNRRRDLSVGEQGLGSEGQHCAPVQQKQMRTRRQASGLPASTNANRHLRINMK